MRVAFALLKSSQHHRHVRCKQDVSMMRMTFASTVLSHVYTGLHLLKRMCRLRLVGAERCLINEEDDFCLVNTQSYVPRSLSS
jgi:hypothetical protein